MPHRRSIPALAVLLTWHAGCDQAAGGGGEAGAASTSTHDGATGATSGKTTGASKAAAQSQAAQSQASVGTGMVPVGCVDYTTFTPVAARFSANVMPIFQARCQSCHDDPTASTYYGADAATVYDKLLDGTPKQAPHLAFVVPFDPLRSYMMAKVEYANPGATCPLVQCSEPGCELSAPPGNPLPGEELDVLRSWVLAGAAND